MKLTASQVATIEKKTGFTPVPESAAAETGLAERFGDDTFYLDARGVYVFEEVEEGAFPDEAGAVGAAAASNEATGAVEGTAPKKPVIAVQIAAVEPVGDDQVTVRAIQPKATSLAVDLA